MTSAALHNEAPFVAKQPLSNYHKWMNMRRHFLFGFMMILTCLAYAEEPEYQDRKNDYPDTYASFPLIHLDLKGEKPQVSFLRYEETGAFAKTRFDTKAVPAGQTLAIRGYWISKNLIDAYWSKTNKDDNTFFKGSDAPSYDQILQAFKNSESTALSEMLGKLSEFRRSSESEAEALKVRETLDPKHQQQPSDFYTQIAYGTGMIEVEDPSEKGPNATQRRFIPLDLVKAGRISIDAKQARVKILQSVLMTIVSDSLLQNKEEFESRLNQAIDEISCRESPCTSNGEVFSQVIEALLKNGTVDNTTSLDMMDDNYQQKLEDAEKQKLRQLLGDLRKHCLP